MKKIFIYFILIMVLYLAGIVAYVSVNGLLKIFAGAGVLGLLFFIGIEVAKIVATSAIHTYRKRIGWLYSILLGIGVIISMVITSIGIYGFLSTSYKESFNSMVMSENKIELIEGKTTLLEANKTNINKDIELKRARITSLLEVRSNQEVRLDSLYNKGWTSSAKRTEALIAKANEDIQTTETDIEGLSDKLGVINDSISAQSLQILDLNQNNEGATELNTLKYLSDITGKSMDYVMKWFILLLIIIGDPMAVLLVIVFNKVINDEELKPKIPKLVKKKPLPEPIEEVEEEPEIEEVVEEPKVEEVVEERKDAGFRGLKSKIFKKSEKGVTLDDINERKRNFSVDIPERNITRVGTNKIRPEDNPNNIIFKRNKDGQN